MEQLQLAIETFIGSCRRPALSEPGSQPIELVAGGFQLEGDRRGVLIQAWSDRDSLARRVVRIESQSRSSLELRVARFGGKTGTLALVDLDRPSPRNTGLQIARTDFREFFRRLLLREYAGWRVSELSTEADLEHSLSPSYPRALLRFGSQSLAAIAAGPSSLSPDGVLTFGLIWLDYLRRRERGAVAGLAVFLPEGAETNTALRMRWLDARNSSFSLFVYNSEGYAQRMDCEDSGNVSTRLDPCRGSVAESDPACERLSRIPGVETIGSSNGALSFRVHGLEFARYFEGELTWGLETKRKAKASNSTEMENLAMELERVREPGAPDRHHPLYSRHPEGWLESQVRHQLESLDASLCPAPVYGQVPAMASCERGVLDLLAVDRSGRLAVIEVKASEDVHLPLQALDYWIRVQWHLDRNEFAAQGYFPGTELRRTPPRLLLVAPALDFHPANETVLRFFSPRVEVERLGVGLEWRKQLKLMFRM